MDAIYDEILPGYWKSGNLIQVASDLSDAWKICRRKGEYEDCKAIGDLAHYLRVSCGQSCGDFSVAILNDICFRQIELDLIRPDRVKGKDRAPLKESEDLSAFLDSFPITGGDAA